MVIDNRITKYPRIEIEFDDKKYLSQDRMGQASLSGMLSRELLERYLET